VIKLRRVTPEDAAALAAVEVRSWRAAYRGLMPDTFLDGLSEVEKAATWRQNLLKHGPSGRKRVCAALSDAGISGFVRVGPLTDEGEVGLLYLIYVLPEHWGRGVGAALMQAGMQELRDLGMRETTLWVLRDNLRARRFYEQLGWTPDGRTVIEDYGGALLPALSGCLSAMVEAGSVSRGD
jgi:RimJ/RimL family protein N-acetyltransferase